MAQEVAHSVARSAYPQGFAADYWNEGELRAWAKLKQPSGLFVGSMADVFGAWVPRENIQQIIDAGGSLPQHVFQFLTKNAPRLLDFDYPPNFWIGASVAPSQIFGKTLTAQQQERMVRRTIQVLQQIKSTTKWMSVEPLSWNVAPIFEQEQANLDWVVIGAASNGKQFYQPDPAWVSALLDVLDRQGTKAFFKGNLDWSPWRAEFPKRYGTSTAPEQARLFGE